MADLELPSQEEIDNCRRLYNARNTVATAKLSPAIRLMANVEMCPKTKCWKWVGRKNKWGYGGISIKGMEKTAHRASFEIFKGPIGEKWVLHSCDNPGCVNPDHLWLGTNEINVLDKCRKNRQAKGSQMPTNKLSERQVEEIIKSYILGVGVREIATKYSVEWTTVYRILKRKIWKYVLPDIKINYISTRRRKRGAQRAASQ